MIVGGGGQVVGADEEIVYGPEFFDGVDGGNLFDGGFVGVGWCRCGGFSSCTRWFGFLGFFLGFGIGVGLGFGDALSPAHEPECEGLLEHRLRICGWLCM